MVEKHTNQEGIVKYDSFKRLRDLKKKEKGVDWGRSLHIKIHYA